MEFEKAIYLKLKEGRAKSLRIQEDNYDDHPVVQLFDQIGEELSSMGLLVNEEEYWKNGRSVMGDNGEILEEPTGGSLKYSSESVRVSLFGSDPSKEFNAYIKVKGYSPNPQTIQTVIQILQMLQKYSKNYPIVFNTAS